FLGIQMIQVAVELIEAVRSRQILVEIAKVVLAELTSGITEGFQKLGDGGVLCLETEGRARDADFGESGAEAALSGDERGASSGAALLAVAIGEDRSFVGDAID